MQTTHAQPVPLVAQPIKQPKAVKWLLPQGYYCNRLPPHSVETTPALVGTKPTRLRLLKDDHAIYSYALRGKCWVLLFKVVYDPTAVHN